VLVKECEHEKDEKANQEAEQEQSEGKSFRKGQVECEEESWEARRETEDKSSSSAGGGRG